MYSVTDVLKQVSLLLSMNGFDVEDVKPTKRSFDSSSSSRSDIYTSPVDFTVKGKNNKVSVWLYGNTLMINNQPLNINAYSAVDVYKAIVAKLKNKNQKQETGASETEKLVKKEQKNTQNVSSDYFDNGHSAHYLAACIY